MKSNLKQQNENNYKLGERSLNSENWVKEETSQICQRILLDKLFRKNCWENKLNILRIKQKAKNTIQIAESYKIKLLIIYMKKETL